MIAIAEAIGAKAIITVTGRVNPLITPSQQDLESWFGEAFAHVLEIAQRSGIELWLENIPMGFYPRAEQLIAFAERIDSPMVGICYDIANAHFIGEDPVAGLAQVRPRLKIVHLSDTKRDAWRHDPVGQGTCDFAGFGRKLQEISHVFLPSPQAPRPRLRIAKGVTFARRAGTAGDPHFQCRFHKVLPSKTKMSYHVHMRRSIPHRSAPWRL